MSILEIAGIVAIFLLGFICGGSRAWKTVRRVVNELRDKDYDLYDDD